jgi:quinol monooxygenase YgiN
MHDCIHVIATIELVPGKRDAFLREFWKIVPQVRAEAGCLEYGPTVDLPTTIAAQAPLRGDVVTIVEKWESLAALEDHLSAPHMQAYRPKVKDLVLSSRLQILQPAENPVG